MPLSNLSEAECKKEAACPKTAVVVKPPLEKRRDIQPGCRRVCKPNPVCVDPPNPVCDETERESACVRQRKCVDNNGDVQPMRTEAAEPQDDSGVPLTSSHVQTETEAARFDCNSCGGAKKKKKRRKS